MTQGPIRLLCVDDHEIFRQGIATIVSRHPDLTVVAFAENGLVAENEYRRHRPDVTLMDLRMPGWGGLEVIRRIRAEDPDARIIVLSMYEGDEDIRRAMDAGAAAYLLKDTLSERLVETIRSVFAGAERSAQQGAKNSSMVLSAREQEVVRLMARGLRNKEIGADLGITEGTVEQHLKRIFAKLQVHDRTAALTVAIRRGIVHIE